MFGFSFRFWLLNIMQMVERLAYWVVVIQLPIYIAQKDVLGGLHWEQSDKGIIFLFWALTQNLTPIFAGSIADRFGHRRVLFFSFIITIIGFILLGTQREFFPFLFGAIVLAIGLGSFKPVIQGEIALSLKKNASIGWGVYVMLINLAIFIGPPLSIYLKNISWEAVFYGSAAVFSLNFILILFLKKRKNSVLNYEPNVKFKELMLMLLKPRLLFFVLIMSGFTINYMQFYETLPNFIYDWSDTSFVASILNLPEYMLQELPRGKMIAYEWLYNLNAGFIIIGVVIFAKLFSNIELTKSIRIGISIAISGLIISGISGRGELLIIGMLVYTLGEMITNPKFNEYIAKIAPDVSKSAFMGFMGVSWAIGLGGGAILGGYLYKLLGEKSGFAIDYISKNFPHIDTITHQQAIPLLLELTGKTEIEATQMLWSLYNPWLVWVPFFIIGILSLIAMYFYAKKYVHR